MKLDVIVFTPNSKLISLKYLAFSVPSNCTVNTKHCNLGHTYFPTCIIIDIKLIQNSVSVCSTYDEFNNYCNSRLFWAYVFKSKSEAVCTV